MKISARNIAVFIFFLMLGSLSGATVAQEIRFLAVGHSAELTNYLTQTVIPEFEEEHGVKVFLDRANWNTRIDKMLVSIAGGVPFDIVATGYYAPYEEGSVGLLEPLDRYVEQWDKRDVFPAPLWEATKWEGQIYHIPHNTSLRGMGYNKRLFGEAGLDPEAPPNSWDELIQATRWLTRTEGDQVAVRGLNLNISNAAQVLFWFMRQAGIPEIDINTFTSNLNRQEARDALRTLAELAESSRYRDSAIGGGQFIQERAAMQMSNSNDYFAIERINPELAGEFGIFAPQRYPDSAPVAHAFIDGLAILEASQNKDLAWKFIEKIHEDDVRLEIKRISGFLSGRVDLVAPLMEVVPRANMFYSLFDHLQSTMIPPPRNQSQTVLVDLVRQVYTMEMSPEEALEHGHELWTRLLNEWEQSL